MVSRLRARFAAVVLIMIALAATAFFAVSRVEARGGCKSACASPPEDCIFLGCDAAGNCIFQC